MMPSNANEIDFFVSYIISYLRSGFYNRKIEIDFKRLRILRDVDLSAETRLLHDLGMYGLVAEDFLEDMHSKYPFDYSGFVFDDYFPWEFSNRFSGFLFVLNHFIPTRVNSVKHFYKPMTVMHIAKALQSGILK
jgi:Protein of unknown function (DUF1493)